MLKVKASTLKVSTSLLFSLSSFILSGYSLHSVKPAIAGEVGGERVSTLEEIVVTATRVEEPKREVPASVQVISEEDIQNSVAKDVGDLMTEAGVGHVHKYPGALTARVGVRGLATDLFSMLNFRALVLIDGHLAGTVNLAKIPVDGIERIEIVKGPASVLYGSSAMGGVINVITKKAKKEGVQGFVGLEGGSWEYWKALSEVSVKKSPIDFYFTASRYGSDDYKAKGYGKIDNTQENYITLLGRLGYKIFGDSRISLGFQHARGWHIGSPGARYSPDPDNYSNKGRTGFDIDYQSKNSKAKYYLVKDKDEWHGGMRSGPGIDEITIKKTDTQGANLQHNFSFGPHRLIVGGQWDRIEVKSSRRPGAPYSPNSRYDTYGIYSEGRLNLLNNKVLLSAGIRYDYFENRILSTPGIPNLKPRKENLDHITARGGLVWKITEALNFKANYGTGFRAPAPDELAADYVASWGTRYLGNPNLKPEKSITTDVGFDYSKGLLKGGITFFHTNFKDKILGYEDPALGAWTWKNVDGATIQGLEINFLYDLGLSIGLPFSLEPFVNITYHTKYSTKTSWK